MEVWETSACRKYCSVPACCAVVTCRYLACLGWVSLIQKGVSRPPDLLIPDREMCKGFEAKFSLGKKTIDSKFYGISCVPMEIIINTNSFKLIFHLES